MRTLAFPGVAPAGVRGHASLLAPIAREEHDDAVGVSELVGAEDQRVSRVERHGDRYQPTILVPSGPDAEAVPSGQRR